MADAQHYTQATMHLVPRAAPAPPASSSQAQGGTPFDHPPLQAPMPRFLQNMVNALGLAPPEPAPAPASGAVVAAAGVGLPPPESPFWQRPDVAEKVLLAVGAIEAERASLASQANESLNAERALTKEVSDLKARGWSA